MADYNPNQFTSPEESKIIRLESELRQVRTELHKYKAADLAARMKTLRYSTSPVQYHVECEKCFAVVREVKMEAHRERCPW